MSTRSCIIVRVKDEDLNKVKKFKSNLLPVDENNWDNYDQTREKDLCSRVTLNKPYIGIYCHSDGYLEGVGAVLKAKFNDYETALNLVIGGDCSCVWFDYVRRYGTRDLEQWKFISPTKGESPQDVFEHIDHEYAYLFENGEWKFRHIGDEDFEFVEY